mmetsp:Transcript_16884/g.25225  ORF Transcript_16884/g.25225 Transcript_16884/m.25225 type:complete len:353 (+) Transcript_16884:105-1163(+)|eukprot:CAMPEP_0201556202 /NCGR_PEP_ID=MMETSP0173_2-20130828/53872_1 /ASSEMBLY_ACC=CAM_ASM_000268 /TAXON_ID=218659 /ORGANISM="Vexillifera sp., Strain DIVA3 564/2" /LENGTH=352 /DNA_ID=CAMNT_0047968351 /DNA_START=65 /DNA_END=1123 /DNA_ORIENTATION=-
MTSYGDSFLFHLEGISPEHSQNSLKNNEQTTTPVVESCSNPSLIGGGDVEGSSNDEYNQQTTNNLQSASCSSRLNNPLRKTTGQTQSSTRYEPFMIGVCGGSASGKTSVCQAIQESLRDQRVEVISLDSYYRALRQDEIENVQSFNFDHPDAFDWQLVVQQLSEIRRAKSVVYVPTYDYKNHCPSREKKRMIYGIDVLLFEGILTFHKPSVRDFFDMKVFVETDSDLRLARRVLRDREERGRSLDEILTQYEEFVKPSFDKFIMPSKRHADVIIPMGARNQVAIQLLVSNIQMVLDSSALSKHRKDSRRAFVRRTPQKQPIASSATYDDQDERKQIESPLSSSFSSSSSEKI